MGLALAGALTHTGAWASPSPAPGPQAAQESPYKDQGEYDLAAAVPKETDPQKKLDLIAQWEQKYPDSKLKSTRALYKGQASLAIALAAYGKPGPADLLDRGAKAAQQVVDNLDVTFAAANKPANASDDQWASVRKTFELQSHSVLGWVAMAKNQDQQAETEFKKILSLDPNQAQISYWLGSVIIRQKNVARYSEALYAIAHALSVTGQTALPAQAKTSAEDYLKRAYDGYHGSTEGLDQLKADAGKAPLPPDGFHIKSITEIGQEQAGNEEEFRKAHPDIGLWRNIKDTLTGDTGADYLEKIKGSEIPGADVGMFKAKVVSVADKDLIVNVDNPAGDATLRFDKKLDEKNVNVGDPLEFKGVVESFTREPYNLVLTIDDPKEGVKGLPDNAFGAGPAPKKKTVPKAAPKATKK
jgi:hypothetical protein